MMQDKDKDPQSENSENVGQNESNKGNDSAVTPPENKNSEEEQELQTRRGFF